MNEEYFTAAWTVLFGVAISAPMVIGYVGFRKSKPKEEKEEPVVEVEEIEEMKGDAEDDNNLPCKDRIRIVVSKQESVLLRTCKTESPYKEIYQDAFVYRCCSKCPGLATCMKDVRSHIDFVIKEELNHRKEVNYAKSVKAALAKFK